MPTTPAPTPHHPATAPSGPAKPRQPTGQAPTTAAPASATQAAGRAQEDLLPELVAPILTEVRSVLNEKIAAAGSRMRAANKKADSSAYEKHAVVRRALIRTLTDIEKRFGIEPQKNQLRSNLGDPDAPHEPE